MKNRYRLSSNAFEREAEQDKVETQKIFFYQLKEMRQKRNILKGFQQTGVI